jgi:hypothetical protein
MTPWESPDFHGASVRFSLSSVRARVPTVTCNSQTPSARRPAAFATCCVPRASRWCGSIRASRPPAWIYGATSAAAPRGISLPPVGVSRVVPPAVLSPHPASAPVDFFWEDLLEYIEEGRVVPIIGAELLTVPDGAGGEVLLQDKLGRELANRLGVPAPDCSAGDALNQVVCRHLERGGRREEIYPRIRNLLKEMAAPIPEPLRQLARIRHFRLFVSTTFDSLLAQAIEEERPGAKTNSLVFAPTHETDLPADFDRHGSAPTVFHVFGRVSASPDYVVTEEDTLEFLTAMQAEATRPDVLLDELKTSHLLLIGNTFPDWLARFFIRIVKNGRLSLPREELEVVADAHTSVDKNLVQFLKNFSYRTQVFRPGSSVDFVRELAERYANKHPLPPSANGHAPLNISSPADVTPTVLPQMAPGAVFLSYASQDAEPVKKIRDGLEAAGIDVWFDQRRLESGDDFDQQIKRNIRSCSFFLPVVSATTQSRHEGYFRLEWNLAVERAKLIADTIPFILPIAIDAVTENGALVPERFLQVQWTRLAGGAPSTEFVERMVRRVREYRKRERG